MPKSTTISGALVAVVRRDGVDEAVGADFLRPVDQRLDAELDALLADDQRIGLQ